MMMEEIFDFLRAALPWIAMGLLLAVFFAQRAQKKEKKSGSDDYAAEGMGFGMCLGLCLFTALGQNIGTGLCVGMLLGLAIGSSIKKEGRRDDKKE